MLTVTTNILGVFTVCFFFFPFFTPFFLSNQLTGRAGVRVCGCVVRVSDWSRGAYIHTRLSIIIK